MTSESSGVPEAGTYISFPTSKHFSFSKQGRGLILAVEREHRVVHMRVKAPFHIGHLAISLHSFLSSKIEVVGSGNVPQDAWSAIALWRSEFASGKAGAFAVDIRQAIEYTKQTLLERRHSEHDAFVESAYPERNEKGELKSIRVIYSQKKAR